MSALALVRKTVFALAALSALARAEPVVAAAPVAKSQPGHYRMMLGDFEVTALSDGTVDLQVAQLLTNTTPARVARALSRQYLQDPVETPVNAYLINTGSKFVMGRPFSRIQRSAATKGTSTSAAVSDPWRQISSNGPESAGS